VLYKSESDVMMYVVGGVDENEIMLYNVILALRDSLHLLFKYTLPSLHQTIAKTNEDEIGNR
jgi:coatomer subunit zeta